MTRTFLHHHSLTPEDTGGGVQSLMIGCSSCESSPDSTRLPEPKVRLAQSTASGEASGFGYYMDARQGHLEGHQRWPVLKTVTWGLSVIQVLLVSYNL